MYVAWLGAGKHLPLNHCRPGSLHGASLRRNIMAKGQQRSNKEVKKPKKDKQTTAPIGTFIPMPKTTLPKSKS
jgi:hypothetical protein